MWPFSRIEKDYAECIKELETLLAEKRIKIKYNLSEPKLLKNMVYGFFLLETEEYELIKFIKTFNKKRKKGNLELKIEKGSPGIFSEPVIYGLADNPDFSQEFAEYAKKYEKYTAERATFSAEKNSILNSEAGKLYQRVNEIKDKSTISEEDKKIAKDVEKKLSRLRQPKCPLYPEKEVNIYIKIA